MMRLIILLLLFFHCDGKEVSKESFNDTFLMNFPENFKFGVATSSYQIEGAWNVSGKGEGIWDRFVHAKPSHILDKSSGDVACDSYHKYKEDVMYVKGIGFDVYRFSLSWPRLFPSGFTAEVNQDGVRYYDALIDEVLTYGIEPMITIYHWDLPQRLQDIGGWLNPDMPDIFAEYARAVFTLFGEKVKLWLTINEPVYVAMGYGDTMLAPGLNYHGFGEYLAGHNLLRAHAKAYRIYDKEFRRLQGGKISIVVNGVFNVPLNRSDPNHIRAADRGNQFSFGWFAHPIFSEAGDYPPVMREYVDRNSLTEGRKHSRLPYFTEAEIEDLKGAHDFMALNHYSSTGAKPGIIGLEPSIARDQEIEFHPLPGLDTTACTWQVNPQGFRELLNWLKIQYNNPEIYITENGYCSWDGIDDIKRIEYLKEYLQALLAAIQKDGCRVIGYTIWSLIDNFEWISGYTQKFGLIRVDFDSPYRHRTMKMSAKFMEKLLKHRRR